LPKSPYVQMIRGWAKPAETEDVVFHFVQCRAFFSPPPVFWQLVGPQHLIATNFLSDIEVPPYNINPNFVSSFQVESMDREYCKDAIGPKLLRQCTSLRFIYSSC